MIWEAEKLLWCWTKGSVFFARKHGNEEIILIIFPAIAFSFFIPD